jgi:hypothetical protein
MSRGKQSNFAQEQMIRQLYAEGYSAAQIDDALNTQGLYSPPNPPLELRTIYRRVKELRSTDLSAPWFLTTADPEDARLVLDVVFDTFDWTGGRVWLSQNLANRVVMVRTASPAIPLAWAYAFALAYQLLGEQDDSRNLDLLLAATPWVADRFSFDQWMRLIDASPSPQHQKTHQLLLVGAYEIGPDNVLSGLRWLPPFEPWITMSNSSLKRFVLTGLPGQRERAWLSSDSGIHMERELGEDVMLAPAERRLTGQLSEGRAGVTEKFGVESITVRQVDQDGVDSKFDSKAGKRRRTVPD